MENFKLRGKVVKFEYENKEYFDSTSLGHCECDYTFTCSSLVEIKAL